MTLVTRHVIGRQVLLSSAALSNLLRRKRTKYFTHLFDSLSQMCFKNHFHLSLKGSLDLVGLELKQDLQVLDYCTNFMVINLYLVTTFQSSAVLPLEEVIVEQCHGDSRYLRVSLLRQNLVWIGEQLVSVSRHALFFIHSLSSST